MANIGDGNYFLKLAKTRKTVYEFSDKKVKNKDIQKILEAARWAPSCSNAQPWHFIVVKEKERISSLMKTTFYGGFHSDPPLLIAVVLDSAHWEASEHRCIKNAKLGTIEAYLSTAMPALSMVFQAEDLGIDSCILTPEQESSSKILRLRKRDQVPIMIGFGYEKKGAFQKKRERNPLHDSVSYEVFGRSVKK